MPMKQARATYTLCKAAPGPAPLMKAAAAPGPAPLMKAAAAPGPAPLMKAAAASNKVAGLHVVQVYLQLRLHLQI